MKYATTIGEQINKPQSRGLLIKNRGHLDIWMIKWVEKIKGGHFG